MSKMGMACKGKVWGIKRERGNERTQDKAVRESSKVRVLGFKNVYRENESHKIGKKLKFKK